MMKIEDVIAKTDNEEEFVGFVSNENLLLFVYENGQVKSSQGMFATYNTHNNEIEYWSLDSREEVQPVKGVVFNVETVEILRM